MDNVLYQNQQSRGKLEGTAHCEPTSLWNAGSPPSSGSLQGPQPKALQLHEVSKKCAMAEFMLNNSFCDFLSHYSMHCTDIKHCFFMT